MTYPRASKDRRDLISSVAIDGFDVSWAGLGQGGDQFCFGSEDGKIVFTDFFGEKTSNVNIALKSEEAVNGIAFLQRWWSVSCRQEIILFTLPRHDRETVMFAPIPFGVHDVVADDMYVFAPAGQQGLVFYRPHDTDKQELTISKDNTGELYFYKTILLKNASGERVVASAVRRNGVASFVFRGEDAQHEVNNLTFDGLDIVDLCSLEGNSSKVAALGKDGTILLFVNVLTERSPLAVRYDEIRGTAYRILAANGFLFILTSDALYVIDGLIEGLRNHREGHSLTPMLRVAMEGVDAFAAGDKWVLIATVDNVLRFDVELLRENEHSTDNVYDEMKEQRPIPLLPEYRHRLMVQEDVVHA